MKRLMHRSKLNDAAHTQADRLAAVSPKSDQVF